MMASTPWMFSAVFGLVTLTTLLPFVSTEIEIPGDEWLSCEYYKEMTSLSNCLCQVTQDETHFIVNCDNVVFRADYVPSAFLRQPIKYYSQRFSNYPSVLPQQIQELDLSHSSIRRLTEKSLEGMSETLEIFHLDNNLLGDQLNPIFSTSEFRRLPRLKILTLGNNFLYDIDSGILEGALSLQELHVDNNELRKVPALPGPNALKILNLSFNRITDLHADDFLTQKSLLLLNMSHNSISMSQSNAFRALSNLKILDLSWNRLLRLNSDSFQGLTTIEAIDLSYNYMVEIPVAALRSLTSLRGLKLSGNLIQNLKDAMIGGSWGSGMEVLDLSRNRISEIPAGFFSGMPKLKEINLGVNQMRTIPGGVFAGLPNLRKLNLMDNNLLTFPSAALDPLTSLTSLTLDYNRISALVPMQIHNLTRLSLSNNLIREIPAQTFENFPQLSELNMYGNLIENLDEVVLPVTLKHLNLGFNSLKACPRFQLPGLTSLNLQKNSLATLLQHNFVLLGQLRELDLSSNAITTFFPNTFDGLDSLEVLNVASNKIEVLPKFGNLENLRELNFSKNHVKEVGIMENMDNLRVLDLSSNSIANLPTNLFSNTTTNLDRIILKNNKLTSFKGFEGSFERLKEINLANNQISYVYPNSFENFQELWILNLNKNAFTVFPTEFLKNCKQLRVIELAKNHIKSLHEMNFSNFPHLRKLTMTENFIEAIPHNSFLNSSQLQYLDISSNKLEALDGNMFHGLYQLELDLSNNYLSSLPPAMFDPMHVERLQKIRLNKNTFSSIPSDALQKQYSHLEELDMSENQIRDIPQNLNILINVKTLDFSKNPLLPESLKTLLNEPKTVRHLSVADTGLKEIPILEMPFLRSLNLSGNSIKGFSGAVFQRTTLLKSLSLDRNNITSLESNFPTSLTFLDISSNPLKTVNGKTLPESLETLKLNHLPDVMKIERTSLNLKNLVTLEMYDLPKLGYLDIRGLLTSLQHLENFDFEVKDTQIIDQIHPGINARVKNIGLRGKQIRSISTGAFAGLTSPSVRISLVNTSLTLLPSILVPVPMSTNVILDLKGSRITNLSPPFLSQNIRLEGLNPMCDCNAVYLIKYLQNVESNAMCDGPKPISVMEIDMDKLICDPGTRLAYNPLTTPLPRQIISTTTPPSLTEDDIIWSIAPKTVKNSKSSKKQDKIMDSSSTSAKRPKAQDINNMDNLIIGIVGGTVGLIVVFIVIIVCFVKVTSKSSSGGHVQEEYPPPAPSVISAGAGGYAPSTKSKCTCPHSHSVKGQMGPMYIPTLYSTVRSNGGGNGNAKLMSQGQGAGQGYPSLPNFPGPMYASYLASPPPNFNYNNNPSNNNYGPSSVRNQQQQQQQQMYASLPYFVQDEYERR